MDIFSSFSKALCLLLISAFTLAWGQSPTLLETGIIVDPAQKVLYVMSPNGGIEAIRIADGTVKWKTNAADQPLSLNGSELVAAAQKPNASGLDIVSLNINGQTQLRSALPLPEKAWASIDAGLGKTMQLRSGMVQDQVVVWWKSSDQDISGMARKQNPTELANAAIWNKPGSRFENRDGLPTPPEQPHLLLVPENEKIANIAGTQWLSSDARHIMVSELVGDDRVWEKYRWTLFDRASSQRLGAIRDHFSTTRFYVSGTHFIHLARPYLKRNGNQLVGSPLQVRVFDLNTGNVLWKHQVRDTSYRGPMPP